MPKLAVRRHEICAKCYQFDILQYVSRLPYLRAIASLSQVRAGSNTLIEVVRKAP
jgi:hypothetical protein